MKKILLLFGILLSYNFAVSQTTAANNPPRYLCNPPLTSDKLAKNIVFLDSCNKKAYCYVGNSRKDITASSGYYGSITITAPAPTVDVVNTLTGAPGTPATVTDTDPTVNVKLAFSIPAGTPGTSTGGGAENIPAVRNVGSNAQLKQALIDAQNTGMPSVINFTQPFTITDSMPWPMRPMMLTLNGNGTKITCLTSTGTVFYRDASRLTSPNNENKFDDSEVMIDAAPFIYNCWFVDGNVDLGRPMKGDLFRISSTYGGVIEKSRFNGFDRQLVLPRNMMIEVRNNRFWPAKTVSIYLTYKLIPGGGSSTSQPNLSYIHDNCFRVDTSMHAAIWIEAGSGFIAQHNPIEGGTNHIGSDYGIDFDYGGSPNVKSLVSDYNHWEVLFKKSALKARINDGFIHYRINYRQYGGTEIEIDGDGGNPQVNYSFQDYIVNNSAAGFTKWKGKDAVWRFQGLPWPINENKSEMWVDGIVPFYRYSEGFGEGGTKYPFFRSNPAFNFNGKSY